MNTQTQTVMMSHHNSSLQYELYQELVVSKLTNLQAIYVANATVLRAELGLTLEDSLKDFVKNRQPPPAPAPPATRAVATSTSVVPPITTQPPHPARTGACAQAKEGGRA